MGKCRLVQNEKGSKIVRNAHSKLHHKYAILGYDVYEMFIVELKTKKADVTNIGLIYFLYTLFFMM